MNRICLLTALMLGLSACAAPSVLIIASTKDNGAKVLQSVYEHNPEVNGRRARIVVPGIIAPREVLDYLDWAEKNKVKYIGMDNGVMGAVPGLIVPKLNELGAKGFVIGGMVFPEYERGL